MENNENKNTRPRRRRPSENEEQETKSTTSSRPKAEETSSEGNRKRKVAPTSKGSNSPTSNARSKEDEFFIKLRNSYKLVFGAVGAVILILFISFVFSFVKYKGAVNSVEKIEKDYEKTIATITAQRDKLQKQADKDKKFQKNLETTGVLDVVKDIEAVQEVLKQKELEVYNIEKEIETRKSAFKTIKGEPIPLIAGQYIFGLDIPTGRYKVVAKELEGKLTIDNEEGKKESDINLGTDKENSRVQREYVFSAYENYVLKTSKNVELFLIENVAEKEVESDDEEKDDKKSKK